MRGLLLFVAGAMLLPAEFLEVRLQVDNMDCETCVKSLEIGLKKTKGVERVSVAPDTGAQFILQPGNKITLERLRDVIKGVGFTPKAAEVVVKGKPMTSDGRWRFEVDGIDKAYTLSAGNDAAIKALREADGKLITVRARSAAPPDPRTTPSLEVSELVKAQ